MSGTNATQMAVTDYAEYKASVLIWKICSPILIIVGTIGNLLSILVLTRKNMRKSTVSIYLIALSISDILVLYSGLLRHIIRYHTQIDIRSINPILCKLNIWFVYFTLDISVWLLVVVTIERIISVWWPHRVRYICTNVTSMITITVIGTILLAVNSHFLYGMGAVLTQNGNTTSTRTCDALWVEYNHFVNRVWPWVDLCLFCLVPFTVLIFGNISIIVKVFAAKKAMITRIVGVPQPGTSQQSGTYNKKTSSMTAMLLCLNIVFLLCTSPVSVYLIGQPYWLVDVDVTTHDVAQHSLIWAVVSIMMYTNNSINFILYCVSGSRFREELKNIFRKTNIIRPEMSFTRANETRQRVSETTTKHTGLSKTIDTIDENLQIADNNTDDDQKY